MTIQSASQVTGELALPVTCKWINQARAVVSSIALTPDQAPYSVPTLYEYQSCYSRRVHSINNLIQ